MNKILSVRDLNNVLSELDKKGTQDRVSYSYKIAEKIDIVYIAGLALYNKLYGTKFSLSYNTADNTADEREKIRKIKIRKIIREISPYFRQYDELYNTRWYNVFTDIDEQFVEESNSYSASFAPIIYINKETITPFFLPHKIESGTIQFETEQKQKITTLKNFYFNRFKNSIENGNENEKNYLSSDKSIMNDLEQSSPIQTFVFIIVYNKIKPLSGTENKTDTQKEAAENLVRQLWQFTKEYCNGLHELAKNIVEHSGESENDGQGMITIRAYDPDNTDTSNNDKIKKVLETHVFDYGEKGIYATLKQNTEKNKTNQEDDIYTQDFKILTDSQNKYTLKDFIEPTDKFLYQQFYRDMAHYGLMNFKYLIERYGGKIVASSIRDDNESKREEYVFPENKEESAENKEKSAAKEEIEEKNITKGTSYYFEMPFDKEKFKDDEYLEIPKEYGTQSQTGALSKLQEIVYQKYQKGESINLQDENTKYLIDFVVSDLLEKKK